MKQLQKYTKYSHEIESNEKLIQLSFCWYIHLCTLQKRFFLNGQKFVDEWYMLSLIMKQLQKYTKYSHEIKSNEKLIQLSFCWYIHLCTLQKRFFLNMHGVSKYCRNLVIFIIIFCSLSFPEKYFLFRNNRISWDQIDEKKL